MSTLTDINVFKTTFEAQQKHALLLRKGSIDERIQKLKKLRQLILDYETRICEAIQNDFHKAPAESLITEINPVLTSISHLVSHLKSWAKPQKKATSWLFLGTSAYVQYEPKGVCLILSPWNYPFQLLFSPLAYAMAAGNTAILKPSEMTPHIGAVMEEMIQKNFRPEEISLFQGDASVATQLLELPFDHIFFTGSPAIGKVVMRAASQHLTSVTLELGGKSPVIVDQTADLKDAAKKIVWGKFINAGQTCIAPDYLLVHKSIEKELINEIKFFIEKSYGQNPENSESYAHIVNGRHLGRLKNLLEDAIEKGATVAVGGKILAQSNCLVPTVLSNISGDMQLMDEEIFGALLPILTYENLDEAIHFINQKPKPLALYVFSENKANFKKILENTSAGGTCLRDTIIHLAHPHLPFGGVNNSGIGKTHGFYGFESFSNARAVLEQRTGMTGSSLIYPPYTEKVQKIAQLIKRFFA